MTINTITGNIDKTVVLGNGTYGTSLSISATGDITPSALYPGDVYAGISADVANASVTNRGTISGSVGYSATVGTSVSVGSDGGIGVDLTTASDTISNFNMIAGGAGGSGYNGNGGAGGVGVVLASAGGVLNNNAKITGGYGGHVFTESNQAGAGGTGVELSSSATANNAGYIAGGAGGAEINSYGDGGSGGSGVDIASGAKLTNTYSITGGAGGFGYMTAGKGGAGVQMAAGATLHNYGGAIVGGVGGATGVGNNVIANAGAGGAGVYLNNAALVSNGAITGGAGGATAEYAFQAYAGVGGTGVLMRGGTLTNSGVITGGDGGPDEKDIRPAAVDGGAGVELIGGAGSNSGQITGGVGGTDQNFQYAGHAAGSGGDGVDISGGGTFSNTGMITGGAGGVDLGHGQYVAYPGFNPYYYKGILGGTGGAGVYVNGGTLTTSGTISGGAGGTNDIAGNNGSGASGYAVRFGSAASTLVVDPGATFNGQVAGNSNDLLALGGTAASTLDGFGTQFTGFGQLQFQSGSQWTVDTTKSGLLSHTPSVTGFAAGDAIDITDVKLSGGLTDNFSGGVLAIDYDGSELIDIDFDNPSGSKFLLTPDATGNGFDITLDAACYQRGTRIRTPRGEVPIEQLSVGEEVLTANGEHKAIRWLGHRRIDCHRHPNPTRVWPIRIEAGALGINTPVRDLWVSPGHSVYLEGVLIQAEKLINGASIVQVPQARVQYWHVELDSHDLLLAEGASSESYLDTGNRSAFCNGGQFTDAYPDFLPKHWSETCVPLILEGEPIVRAKRTLLERATALGYTLKADADLHILADGERIEPIALGQTIQPAQSIEPGQTRLAFLIPPERRRIELCSRTFLPTHIDPSNPDSRKLGVYVRRLQIDGEEVPLDDAALFAQGWHGLENDGQAPHRWSMERTPLPTGARLIVVEFLQGSWHWARPAREVAAQLVGSG